MRLPRIVLAMAAGTSLVTVATAGAGDHLACYKVKDTLPKHKFQGIQLPSNSGEVPTQTGCSIATGAKLCCDSVDKLGVPAQPGGATAPGPSIGKFCCYKVKCSGGPTGSLTVTDQFGSRTLPVVKPPRMICAPDVPIPTTTIPTTTTTTTTTLPCLGTPVGPACWFLGIDGASCDTTCTNQSRVYDPATASYAGSGGTDAQCGAVLDALMAPGTGNSFATDCNSLGGAVGCAVFGTGRIRCLSPATTSGAGNPGFRRACACR